MLGDIWANEELTRGVGSETRSVTSNVNVSAIFMITKLRKYAEFVLNLPEG